MKRWIYFIVPNSQNAAQLATDLARDTDITQQSIQAMNRDTQPIKGVSSVHSMDETDTDERIEWWGWRINLAIYFTALMVFILMLFGSPGYWLFAPMSIMLVTFVVGLVFALYVPKVHLSEFFTSTSHGEVLLMIDVNHTQVNNVSRYIRQYHPEAITGGVCWHF